MSSEPEQPANSVRTDPTDSEYCGLCRFWKGLKKYDGAVGPCCRFPVVERKPSEDWCGEFKAPEVQDFLEFQVTENRDRQKKLRQEKINPWCGTGLDAGWVYDGKYLDVRETTQAVAFWLGKHLAPRGPFEKASTPDWWKECLCTVSLHEKANH